MREAVVANIAGLCLAAVMLPGCSGSSPVQPFTSAGTALQSYDYSRLTPFPRKLEKPVLGTPFQPDIADQAEILTAIAPRMADPASTRIVRLQARSRQAGAIELCGLAQSRHQTGDDARMVLFAGHLTRSPDGSPHFSHLPDTDMFDRVEFCRSRGLV